ncbi:MAG: glutamate racemase [bacterium]
MISEISSIRKIATGRITDKAAGEKPEANKVAPSSPIGIFDSGVGGLTVLAEIMRQLPHEDIIYFADTARVPYGNRPPEEIVKINEEIIPYLIDHGAKLIVMACGTSSAIAYPVLKDRYKVHLINLIMPGSKAALEATKTGKIGVMATVGTVNSGAYQEILRSLRPDLEVTAVACPLFVPLIERGLTETDETRQVIKEYLKPLKAAGVDTIILGCTHYPHLARLIQEQAGQSVKLVDPAEETARETKKLLKDLGTLKPLNSIAKHEYLVTGPLNQFLEVGSRLLGRPITHAKHVIM